MLSDWQDLKGKTLKLNVFADVFLSVFFPQSTSAPAVPGPRRALHLASFLEFSTFLSAYTEATEHATGHVKLSIRDRAWWTSGLQQGSASPPQWSV